MTGSERCAGRGEVVRFDRLAAVDAGQRPALRSGASIRRVDQAGFLISATRNFIFRLGAEVGNGFIPTW